MKIALCFIINYDHILYKEEIWRNWIEENKDIINIYFYYKDFNKIKSKWIQQYAIPTNYIYDTTYYHVVPAYISLIKYAIYNDRENQWFCFLTDSCCPIISPEKFRLLFYLNYKKSILCCKKAWWNIYIHKRSNLALLPKELHLGNDPWFTLCKNDANNILQFIKNRYALYSKICSGGLANESIFAIMLYCENNLKNTISKSSHIVDWSRMMNPTSPYLFKLGDYNDLNFIEKSLNENKYAMFIRKISPIFPNSILKKYIYVKNNLNLKEKITLFLLNVFFKWFFYIKISIFLFLLFFTRIDISHPLNYFV